MCLLCIISRAGADMGLCSICSYIMVGLVQLERNLHTQRVYVHTFLVPVRIDCVGLRRDKIRFMPGTSSTDSLRGCHGMPILVHQRSHALPAHQDAANDTGCRYTYCGVSSLELIIHVLSKLLATAQLEKVWRCSERHFHQVQDRNFGW